MRQVTALLAACLQIAACQLGSLRGSSALQVSLPDECVTSEVVAAEEV